MGSIAGANISMISMVAMEHDLEAKLSSLQDQQMILSQKSIFLADKKATVYGNYANNCDSNGNVSNKENEEIQLINAMERRIQSMEKQLEIQMKSLQTQLEQVQKRKEAEEKRLQKNIQSGFSYGLGGGR